jgi:RNA polymerase sigma factor (sigma-70 family)
MSDAAIPMTARDRDDARRAFADLLEQHRKIVFKVASTYAWQPADRADLAQEIAAQLWRAYPSYDPARPFSTWMYRVALNVAISHVRRDTRRAPTIPLDDHDVPVVSAPEPDDRVHALQQIIAALAPLDRALLLLYLDERPAREIADILGLTETNVSTKISRLKQRIRGELTATE